MPSSLPQQRPIKTDKSTVLNRKHKFIDIADSFAYAPALLRGLGARRGSEKGGTGVAKRVI